MVGTAIGVLVTESTFSIFVRHIESSVENCMSQRGAAGAVYCLVGRGLVNFGRSTSQVLRPSAPPPVRMEKEIAWTEKEKNERDMAVGVGRWR